MPSKALKVLFFLLIAAIYVSPAHAYFPQGEYQVDAVIKDPGGPWEVVFKFKIGDHNNCLGGKVEYPHDPCAALFSQVKIKDNKLVLKEKVVAGNDVCPPASYTLEISPVTAADRTNVSKIKCELKGGSIQGDVRRQKFIPQGNARFFFKKYGATSWHDLAAGRNTKQLLEFYQTYPNSFYHEKTEDLLLDICGNDPSGETGVLIFTATRNRRFSDQFVEKINPSVNYATLVKAFRQFDQNKWNKRLHLSMIAKSSSAEAKDYSRYFSDIGCPDNIEPYQFISFYGNKYNDLGAFEFIAGQRLCPAELKLPAEKIVYENYSASGKSGYQKFISRYSSSSLSEDAENRIVEIELADLLATSDLAQVERKLKAHHHLTNNDEATRYVIGLCNTKKGIPVLERFKKNFSGTTLCTEASSELARLYYESNDIPKLKLCVTQMSAHHPYYKRIMDLLYKGAVAANTEAEYRFFLGLNPDTKQWNDIVERLYKVSNDGSSEHLVAFAKEFYMHAKAGEAWDIVFERYTKSGMFSSVSIAKVSQFLKFNPPKSYVKKCGELIKDSIQDADETRQIAFIKEYNNDYPAVSKKLAAGLKEKYISSGNIEMMSQVIDGLSPVYPAMATEMLKSLRQVCLASDNIENLSWFIATYGDRISVAELEKHLAQEVFTKVVEPKNDVDSYNLFCITFAKTAPKRVLELAYQKALDIIDEEISDEIGDAEGVFSSNPDQMERVVYKLYNNMVKAKDDRNTLLAGQLGAVLESKKEFHSTKAFFDLSRDKEMRRFLGKSFDSLISVVRRNTEELSVTLNQVAGKLSSEIKRTKPTRDELRQKNWDYYMDGVRFKQMYGKTYHDYM
ncbi:hypothetical protein [Maridesulfovibrio sp.]|uniref:hypothetical protein n=1 Tax=Maridesulfovibrio sp. TaxID=2795000 RepID=UPI002A18B570|nr:hypothetical protein [Maridesulfovibrio sp.]